MKPFGAFLGVIAVVMLLGGTLAITQDFPGGRRSREASSSTPPSVAIASTAPSAPAAPEGDSTSVATNSESSGGSDVDLFVVDVQVDAPSMELPTEPLMTVEATYTEMYQFEDVSIAFRPGAYSAEYAAEVATIALDARDEANQKLGTAWNDDFTVFLADQLFAEDCMGCQGFTESDFRWIFMLDDGSVVRDEYEALLVHEMTHLIAGNEIHLPFELFYVEGLATWVMTDDLVSAGYVSPLQSTAWTYQAGALPPLAEIIEDDFAGRMRKRVYYDASASFAFFTIERYGYQQYLSLYRQNSIESVTGKSLAEVEAEWHAFLEQYADAVIAGTDADKWWKASSQVIAGFERFYLNPSALSAEQYRSLTLSRLALNSAEVDSALHYLTESGV